MEPLFAFVLGPVELGIVAVVALLLFGHRLPQAMRGLGGGFKEFKNGVSGIESEVKEVA